MAVFFGISGKARKVNNIYIGVGGKARKVKAAWIGIGGKARKIWPIITATEIINTLNYSRVGTDDWNIDDKNWTYYNYSTNRNEYGAADQRRLDNIINNYAKVSTNYLEVKAHKWSSGNDSHQTNGVAARITNQVNLTGKTKITVKYKVNAHGAQLGGYTANDSILYLYYGTAIPNSGKVNITNGYTQIGNSGSINSKAVNGEFTMSFNINISGNKNLMLLLDGQPTTVSRDDTSMAGAVTIQSILIE